MINAVQYLLRVQMKRNVLQEADTILGAQLNGLN